MLYYYKNSYGACTARSFPLILDGETEISKTEYDKYIINENKKYETE